MSNCGFCDIEILIDYQAMTEEVDFKILKEWHKKFAQKDDVTPKD